MTRHTGAEILAVARTLFAERGYERTSMREIAAALGICPGSLYGHIDSKEVLLENIINEIADKFLALTRSIPENIPQEVRLHLLLEEHLKLVAREQAAVTILFHDARLLDSASSKQLRLKQEAYKHYVQTLVEDGARQGIFRVEDAHLATLFVLSTLNVFSTLGGIGRLEQACAQYTRLVLCALKGC